MSATSRRCAFSLLVVLLALPATPAAAVPLDTNTLLAKVQGLLSIVWEEVGCQIDPWGACAPNLVDHGCENDLEGRCKVPRTDTGCELDPWGRRGN